MEPVVLLKIDKDNRSYYKDFDAVFEHELNLYQSRIYPNDNSEQLSWYYITHRDKIIGSVWLEKETLESTAVLGIFIADKTCRGKGIGKQAIRQIIGQDAVRMGVQDIHLHVRETNRRAYRCYRSLGFEETGRYIKVNGVSAISMSISVNKILQS